MGGVGDTRGRTGVLQSVERALHVLDLVAAHPDGITARDVAARLDLALPTVYHLVATLVANGYLTRLPARGGYVLGPSVGDLAVRVRDQLAVPDGVARAVHDLHVRAGAAAYYAAFRDRVPVVAYVADSQETPRLQPLDVGFHEATHALAFGKVMLSGLSRDERHDVLRSFPVHAFTAATVADPAGLERQIVHVAESGLAVEVDEFRIGLSCLAAPVRDRGGRVVGAVAISTETVRLREQRAALERTVRLSGTRCTRATVLAGR